MAPPPPDLHALILARRSPTPAGAALPRKCSLGPEQLGCLALPPGTGRGAPERGRCAGLGRPLAVAVVGPAGFSWQRRCDLGTWVPRGQHACISPFARVAALRPIRLFINNDAQGGGKSIRAFKKQTGWERVGCVCVCVGELVKAIKLRSLPWRDSSGYNALGGIRGLFADPG